jgi:hypothetical protein
MSAGADFGRARLPQNLRLLSEALNFCRPSVRYTKTRAEPWVSGVS